MEDYPTETSRITAQQVNNSFLNKLQNGREKEAAKEGTNFIRKKLRQNSFAREILTPKKLSDDQIDRDENTDQPKKIVEIEPDSTATFVPFKGSARQRYFSGPRYAVYFGKVESERFQKNKFELMTYENDIRKILSDNSVKDMSDEEDSKFLATCQAVIDQNNSQLETISGELDMSALKTALKNMASRQLGIGKILMTRERYYDLLDVPASDVGDEVASRHYDEGVETEGKIAGYPVVTTIKNHILPSDEAWVFAPEDYLGNFFLLQDATLFIEQRADMIEFFSYSAPGIGIGNTDAITKLKFT